jgi:pyruvate formate lyase activating enzyme
MMTMTEILDQYTVEGKLYERLDQLSVRCFACAHRCVIPNGKRGVCKVRFNSDGILKVPWGYVAALQMDPIEKKPFSHFFPGAEALTFGMLGCDFHCAFCQNWLTSQTLRDPSADQGIEYLRKISPEQIVDLALRSGAEIVASSYNEPLITTEWAVDIFRIARQKGLKCVYISNGNATVEALDYLRPYLDGYKIDLKSMQQAHYRELGGKLSHVLDTIQKAHDSGLWVEVVTLVIPDYNDSSEELWEAARFLASVSLDIPWHVTAFHPDYLMNNNPPTPSNTLLRAAEIGQEAGLHYVYAGNLPGRVGSMEDTFCPKCSTRLIQRRGYTIKEYKITAAGTCPKCGATVAGRFTTEPEKINLQNWGMPRSL